MFCTLLLRRSTRSSILTSSTYFRLTCDVRPDCFAQPATLLNNTHQATACGPCQLFTAIPTHCTNNEPHSSHASKIASLEIRERTPRGRGESVEAAKTDDESDKGSGGARQHGKDHRFALCFTLLFACVCDVTNNFSSF